MPTNKPQKFWDKHARKYATSKIADQAEYENGLEVTKTFLSTDQRVLEIGCGTGTTALILAPDVGQLTATDISPEMIAICNEKKLSDGIENIDFKVASAVDPNLADGQFDVVLAFSLLHLVQDIDDALAQVSRVLKPGGMFISKTPCLSEHLLFSLLRLPLFLAEKVSLAPNPLFFKADQLDQLVMSAGFELVHTYTHEKAPKRRYIAAKKATG